MRQSKIQIQDLIRTFAAPEEEGTGCRVVAPPGSAGAEAARQLALPMLNCQHMYTVLRTETPGKCVGPALVSMEAGCQPRRRACSEGWSTLLYVCVRIISGTAC